jgi:hypothetical protein
MTHASPWLTIANLPLLQLRSTLGLPSYQLQQQRMVAFTSIILHFQIS